MKIAGEHISIVTPRLWIIDVGEPFDFGWHFSQAQEARSAQKRLAGGSEAGKSEVLKRPTLLGFINNTRS